jgi:hypothetical protein
MSHTAKDRRDSTDYVTAHLDHAARNRRHSGRPHEDLRATREMPAVIWTPAALDRLLDDVQTGMSAR